MKCPICNVDLQMTDRQGIEIDYCPQCRGVWLDRGELDKLIERSAARDTRWEESPPPSGGHAQREEHHDARKHKKKSMWSEFFDFD
jgi:Zn-finger nucleic acid-binding protein